LILAVKSGEVAVNLGTSSLLTHAHIFPASSANKGRRADIARHFVGTVFKPPFLE
jgi:hypothetical protein